MMKKWFLLLCIMVLSLLVTACGGLSGKNVFTDAGEMTKIMNQLQERSELKGKDIKVFQDVNVFYNKEIGGNVVIIDILKPGTEDVDHYEYKNGSWSNPSPVQITGTGNIMDNVIPLSDLHLDKVADIYKAAEAKAKEVEGLKVEQSFVYRFWNGKWDILITAKSDRAKYSMEYGVNGELKEFKKL